MADVYKMVMELRNMGIGAELEDATLSSLILQNNHDMDQVIDAVFALSLQEEAPPAAPPPPQQQHSQPPAPQQAPQQAEDEGDEEEIDEMTAILLGLPWPPPEKPPKKQAAPPPPAQAPAHHQAPPVHAAAFVPSHQQQGGNNGFGQNQQGDGFQTVSRPQQPRGGGGGAQPVRLVVLVGPPGSGKSTAAEMFGGAGWYVVSQDALGNRQECEHACWAALEANQRVVVDRTNIDEFQRSHWVGIARKARVPENGIVCLSFNVPVETCKQRVMSRRGHRTLPPTRGSMQVVDRFVSSFVPPKTSEGFGRILTVAEYHDPRVFDLIGLAP